MKTLRLLLAIVALVAIVVFSVVNRGVAEISFFPLPLPAVPMPVYAVFLIGLVLGVVLGGFALWLSQAEMRSEWRQLRRKARAEAYDKRQQELAEEEAAAERSRQRQEALALAAPRR